VTELDAGARDLLGAFRRATSPAAVRCEAGLADVEARIVADADAPLDDGTPARAPASIAFHLRSAAIALAIAAAVLLVIRAVAFAVSSRTPERPPLPDAASDTPVVASPPARAVAVEPPAPSRAIEAETQASPPPAAEPMPAVSQHRIAPSQTRARDDLVAEVALLREAKGERAPAAALELLDRHAREFPNGALARERDVLRAERLCALGRTTEARALADRFTATHASDPLADRMENVCR
jgi:hypothetical protein